MMSYRLEVFRKVAESGSITKAARALHLSQPAVTRHIQILEGHLRMPLFTRTAQGMRLTRAGIVYLEHVQQVALAHESIVQRLHAATGTATG
ncbi:MAG TPA: LysR family transcriptional regulator, partial [Verrucomicrobiae bacterium]|nr:LysR family transcriptional regulator [Verrucomicrobiae bacterium]